MPQMLVSSIHDEAKHIKTFELVDPESAELQAFSAGSHIEIELPDNIRRHYSLCNDPSETHRYLIAVLQEKESRGGSQSLHYGVKEGDLLEVSIPKNNFPLDQRGMHFILIAGGIGITPLLSMAYKLKTLRKPFELHMCARSHEYVPFKKELEGFGGLGKTHMYISDGDPSRRLDVSSLLKQPLSESLVYCCGPQSLMDAVGQATSDWGAKKIHFETFTPRTLDGSDLPFHIKIASTGQSFHVNSTTTILEALHQNGIRHPFSCEVGLCRTCVTGYQAGDVEHLDQDALSNEERKGCLTICVSRCTSDELILDL
jgi:ferredoxin-NADP reductase